MNERRLVGVDEVGRGCLAGAVIAAAVILDPDDPIEGLADSKSLSSARRETLSEEIRTRSLFWSIGRAEACEIDRINILQASLLAMSRALQSLDAHSSVWIQVDGRHFPETAFPGECVIKGDQRVSEISAASILAKVARDSEMNLLDSVCPGYGFERNKGYPTTEHLGALRSRGLTPFHRRSFAPVRKILNPDD